MIEIGRFEIDLSMRALRHDGEDVHLGSRAFDILAFLASAGGRLVTKDELMDAVWPNTIVEENNIQVHLSAVRKVLGPDRDLIITVPGRGYQLKQRRSGAAAGQPKADQVAVRALPLQKLNLIGRESAVQRIVAMLDRAHVLTLTGAGGIGKTSLAIEVARQVAADYPGGVSFVELAALTRNDAVLAAIAEACGLRFADREPTLEQISAALANQRRLLLIDNAEHVVDVLANAVEVLAGQNDALRVLVTSREPLRIGAETVFRVGPLDVPAAGASCDETLAQSAVQLFFARAKAIECKVGAEADEVRLVGEICRRLDGIPLAIELAAARATALGVEGVYRRLDDRLKVLSGGHRTALPRHQTLRATFDWSYAILEPKTQAVFRRLALFGGLFGFEAICAVACDDELTLSSVIAGIDELIAKSLVAVEFDGPVARYRLPESTRAYAIEKLRDEGEMQATASRHARYLASCFGAPGIAEDAAEPDPSLELRQALDDARSAFDWAFSPDGDARLGIELASGLLGALFDRSMLEECCRRAALAVKVIEGLPPRSVEAANEMRIRAALAATLLYVRGSVGQSAELWRQVLELAVESDNDEFHARALRGLWSTMLASAKIHDSLRYATRFQWLAVERGSEWQQSLAGELIAVSLHCLGEHAKARHRLEEASQRRPVQHDKSRGAGFAVDPLIFSNATLARIVWMQGDPDRALEIVDETVGMVRPEAMEPSLSHLLGAAAVPLALMSGDLPRAAHYLEIMRSQAAVHQFQVSMECCDCLDGYLDILDGCPERGLPVLEAALDALLARGFRRLATPLIVACSDALVAAGRLDDASRRLEGALEFCNSNGELFFVPDVWRALGVVAHAKEIAQRGAARLQGGERGNARSCFRTAIAIARGQGARMWELRASIALARCLIALGQARDALRALEEVAVHFDAQSRASDIRTLFELVAALRGKEHHAGVSLSQANA